jgi:hypothetical protein
MKVPGSDGSSDIAKRVQEVKVDDRSIQRRGATDVSAQGASGLVGELAKEQRDKITLSPLGDLIRRELDPTKMAAERQSKIDNLKKQIREGTYARASDDVAQALAEEVSLEVIFNQGQ